MYVRMQAAASTLRIMRRRRRLPISQALSFQLQEMVHRQEVVLHPVAVPQVEAHQVMVHLVAVHHREQPISRLYQKKVRR